MIRAMMAVVGLVVCGAAYVVATSKPAVAGADNTGVVVVLALLGAICLVGALLGVGAKQPPLSRL